MNKTIPIPKTCPSCKEMFYVCPPGRSSRTYPKNEQVFCCVECANKSRYRSGTKCAELTNEQAAYIAGFLDADGSVFLYKRRDSASLRVTFSNSRIQVLEYIQSMIQFGSIVKKPRKSAKHKTAYLLQLNAELAESLLDQIEPFIFLKNKQAKMGIEFQQRLQEPSLKSDRTWQREWLTKMQLLNKRGN